MAAKFVSSSLTDKKAIARITTRDDAISMKTLENGTIIQMAAYVKQEVTKDMPGNVPETFMSILVLDANGTLYATRSDTFMRKIEEIMELFVDEETGEMPDLMAEPISIKITKQTAKSGNTFVSCAFV